MNFYFSYTLLPTSTSSILHAKLDDGMANNFSSRRSFELILLPTGSYSLFEWVSSPILSN